MATTHPDEIAVLRGGCRLTPRGVQPPKVQFSDLSSEERRAVLSKFEGLVRGRVLADDWRRRWRVVERLAMFIEGLFDFDLPINRRQRIEERKRMKAAWEAELRREEAQAWQS